MPLSIRIESLTISDGTKVAVPDGGVIVFVGPNNAGKSVALRDIDLRLTRQPQEEETKVVKDIALAPPAGDVADLEEWLDANSRKELRSGTWVHIRPGSAEVARQTLTTRFEQGAPYQELAAFFRFYGGAEQRLQASNGSSQIDYTTQLPSHALHHLYLDPDREERVSLLSEKAFGLPLTLNRHAGAQIYLHVGKPDTALHASGAPTREYLSALANLPKLQEQGDGVRSFIGLVLNLSVGHYFFTLVDEPEAFLHPPQAHLLGRMLGDLKAPDSQLFLATHDSNVLRGILDSKAEQVTVVRLVREREVNRTSQLDPDDVKGLWKDPLLRYSNILDGLFHQAVVLCEADADCRYYASVLDGALDEAGTPRRPELLWTHCGGKHRMPIVINSLRAVAVPVKVIADFDVLREESPLREIVAALGGDWSELVGPWHRVRAAMDTETKSLETHYVRQEMPKILERLTEPRLSDRDEAAIRDLTRGDSAWSKAKRSGIEAVPHGEPRETANKLIQQLKSCGLFVVPVGEVEGFAPEVGNHGTAWVAEVHERGLHLADAASAARHFIGKVVDVPLN